MASRYSGFGSRGSRARRKASTAIRGNRAASSVSHRRSPTRRSRNAKDVTIQNAVGGSSGLRFR